jgi:hypothetical protein
LLLVETMLPDSRTPVLPGKLPLQPIRRGTVIYRAHSPSYSALYFGPDDGRPPTHRFHSPDGGFQTCFAGLSEEAAFAEGVLHGPVPTQLISRQTLEQRAIAELHVVGPIRAVPLYGEFLMRLGATATVTHGDDYSVSQAWAKALYEHPQRLDAILYTSRHDETTFSVALFDRARAKLTEGRSIPLSIDDERTLMLLSRYGLGLIQSRSRSGG